MERKAIPIILVYSKKRQALVDQTLCTLSMNTDCFRRIFYEPDSGQGNHYIEQRNGIASDIKSEMDYDYICFADDDLYFNKGWLNEMVDVLEKNDDIKIVSGTDWFTYKRLEDRGNAWVSDQMAGGCLLMSRETWEKYGPFDVDKDKTNMFRERVQKDGFKVAFLKDRMKVVHCGIGSIINVNGRSKKGEAYIRKYAEQIKDVVIL